MEILHEDVKKDCRLCKFSHDGVEALSQTVGQDAYSETQGGVEKKVDE